MNGQPGVANYAQAGTPLNTVLIEQLKSANQAEVELATIARDRTENQELKNLASTIISDHEKFRQDVEKVSQKVTSSQQTGPFVPQQLTQLTDKACKNAEQSVKAMLEKAEGQDFQMAFLGQQVIAHQMMIANLEAIQSVGPTELKEIAGQGVTMMKSHLDAAKSLAMKLEDDSKNKQNNQ